MARLNEPPVSTDSFDALRRKFLRQNRDIARVNSNQSLRIRGLENECARLLSENLDLRGQVLRLEKELESNSSQRIADHALQIKRKMETQLLELSTLLADFGLEPPTKRPSPPVPQRSVTKALARLSLAGETASPLFQQKRNPALAPQDAETLAAQEGRLPPIFENKTYPRQVLTKEELRALLSDDSTSLDSSELGPAPVSRLFHDEPRKPTASPSRPSRNDSNSKENIAPGRAKTATTSDIPSSSKLLAEAPAQTATQLASSTNAKQRAEKERRAASDSDCNSKTAEADSVARPTTSNVGAINTVSAPTKAGAKRKFAVNENSTTSGKGTANGGAPEINQTASSATVRELKNPRSIRDLVNSRSKDAKEDGKEGNKAMPSGGRKPLAAKSTNEDVSSPRKRSQESNGGKPMKAPVGQAPGKPTAGGGGRMRDRMKQQLPVVPSAADVPAPPEVVEISVDDNKDDIDGTRTPCLEPTQPQPTDSNAELPSPAEPPSAATTAVCPSTPPPLASLVSQRLAPTHGEGGRDTPPPADISSQGETTRPSRRARTSVSYVEPNLRDKMRRPTKELFDAVAGEGKYVQRQQHQNQQHNDEAKSQPATGTPVPQPQSPASSSGHSKEQPQPLVSKQHEAEGTSTTDRRRHRVSSVGAGASSAPPKSQQTSTGGNTKEKHAVTDEKDPYDFLTSLGDASISTEEAGTDTETGAERIGRPTSSGGSRKSISGGGRAASKATRRSSAAAASSSHDGDSAMVADRHTRPSAARKRASMAALKRGSLLDSDDEDDDPADSSYEPAAEHSSSERHAADATTSAMPTRDRISRRRSMML